MDQPPDSSPPLTTPSSRIPSDRHLRRLADWSRHRLGAVGASASSAVQVGVAAALAWWLATTLLPWNDPIYAPIGAVVAIGTGEDRLLTRPVRLLGGMVVAIAVAGIVVAWAGSGAWQIGVITILATLVGRFLFDDALARTYSAFHGAAIGALGVNGVIPEQLVEAAIGAASGIVIAHLLFPPRVQPAVLRPVQEAGHAARRSLAAVAAALATARSREVERAVDAAVEVEAHLAPDDHRRAFGRQLVRFAPVRRRDAAKLDRAIEADRGLTSLLLGVADLARQAHALLAREPQTHRDLSRAVGDLDLALGRILQEPFDDHLLSEIDGPIQRLQTRIDGLEAMTPPQEMLAENLREASELLHGVAEALADRTDGV